MEERGQCLVSSLFFKIAFIYLFCVYVICAWAQADTCGGQRVTSSHLVAASCFCRGLVFYLSPLRRSAGIIKARCCTRLFLTFWEASYWTWSFLAQGRFLTASPMDLPLSTPPRAAALRVGLTAWSQANMLAQSVLYWLSHFFLCFSKYVFHIKIKTGLALQFSW